MQPIDYHFEKSNHTVLSIPYHTKKYVIQLIGCGLTPEETYQETYGTTIQSEQCPFLVLEYAEVSFPVT